MANTTRASFMIRFNDVREHVLKSLNELEQQLNLYFDREDDWRGEVRHQADASIPTMF